jgi:hypothetical protein
MRPALVAGLVGALFVAGARGASAQSSSDQARGVPGRLLYGGMAGEALISDSPGLAAGLVIALEWKHLLFAAEVSLGETFSGWDMFDAGAQAGAVLLPAADTPYLLAGVEHRIFVDIVNEKRGRTDSALTGETGYLFRRPTGVRQVWLGARGILPVTSHVYSSSAPTLAIVLLIVKVLW